MSIPARQLGRYLVAGGTATLVHLCLLAALVELLGTPATLASAIGFCIACGVNYTIQYYWTFAAVGSHGILFARYALVTIVMLGVNTVFFWLLHSRAGAPYLLAQALATAMVVGLNFETNRRYTFKSL